MSISKGYTDTPISGVTLLNLKRGLVNFGADFRVLTDSPAEVTLTNLTSPLDRPEKYRFAHTIVKDIYKGSDVHPKVQAPSSKGVNVLCQLTNTVSELHDTAPDVRTDLPISAHLVLKFPASPAITAEMLEEHVGRLVSGLFETGSTNLTRLKSLMRGSLLPSDI